MFFAQKLCCFVRNNVLFYEKEIRKTFVLSSYIRFYLMLLPFHAKNLRRSLFT